MTPDDALRQLGVKAIRRLSDHTTVVEYARGAAPATQLEQRMWALIVQLLSKH